MLVVLNNNAENEMITVPTKHLKAALLAVPKHDIRYYLLGVFLEASAAETRCVATTGALAVVLRHPCVNDLLAEVILPREVVEAAVKMKRDETEFEKLDASHWLMNGTHRFKPCDGKYPDYRRIFPRAVSGEATELGFDPELFAVFGKVAVALGKKSMQVSTHLNGATGTAAITIEGCPEFAGLISPLRITKDMKPMGVQGWAGQ